MPGRGEITRLLGEWSGGNQAALDQLVTIVYDELHRLASIQMRAERPGHLLQTTALANEAYLRLVHWEDVNCQTRTKFFALSAQVMRRVLVDHARGRDRAKRGAGVAPVSLDDAAILSDDRASELLAIDFAGTVEEQARRGIAIDARLGVDAVVDIGRHVGRVEDADVGHLRSLSPA